MTVVFVSHNSARDLDRALASLAENSPGLPAAAVVVENGPDPAPARVVCARRGAALALPGRNLGYGRAANLAAAGVATEYLAVANPDILFQPGTLNRLVEFLDSHPDVGVVAPQLFYPDGRPQPSARRRPRFRYALAGRRSPLARLGRHGPGARAFQYLGSESALEPMAVDAVVGALMLFRRRAFEEVGGFDPGYFMFAEDVDICLRLGRRWRVCLLPAAGLVHALGSSRRRARSFTEFHRLRSLHRLFALSYPRALRPLITLLFTGYLGLLMALAAVGVGEFEYSWSRAGR